MQGKSNADKLNQHTNISVLHFQHKSSKGLFAKTPEGLNASRWQGGVYAFILKEHVPNSCVTRATAS